ncbi:MAG: hypothetical protein ACRDUB_13645, partial [Mycobacterium sp.]
MARKKVVDHLTELGLVDTAKAILSAPPSILPEFMKAMGIEESVLGDLPMPSTHANPPSAGLLIAAAKAEQVALAGPQITPEQQALDAAQEALAAAEKGVEDARKAVSREQARRRKLLKEFGTGDEAPLNAEQMEQLADASEAIDAAKVAYAQAKLAVPAAEDDVVAARYGVATTLPEEERDAYCANLSAEDVEA